MLEVEKVRPVRVNWRIMSLAYLNLIQHDGEGLTPEYLERMGQAWGPIRVVAAAAHEAGTVGPRAQSIRPSARGSTIQGRRNDPEVIAEALAEVALGASLAGAAAASSSTTEIKKSHHEAFDVVGTGRGHARYPRPRQRHLRPGHHADPAG